MLALTTPRPGAAMNRPWLPNPTPQHILETLKGGPAWLTW